MSAVRVCVLLFYATQLKSSKEVSFRSSSSNESNVFQPLLSLIQAVHPVGPCLASSQSKTELL